MEIFNAKSKEEHVQARTSITILIMKLITLLVIFELIYGAFYYVLTLGIPLPFDLHHHIATLIFTVGIFKIPLQSLFILFIVLNWANIVYFIDKDGKHLVKRSGIININEDIYQLDTIRSLSVNQSLFGRIFNYGDVTLKTSASGGYQDFVRLSSVSNPKKFEHQIKECIS